jgi:hypothetical protein
MARINGNSKRQFHFLEMFSVVFACDANRNVDAVFIDIQHSVSPYVFDQMYSSHLGKCRRSFVVQPSIQTHRFVSEWPLPREHPSVSDFQTAMMTFVLLGLVATVAGQVVLNRIQTTSLGFADEVCGNLTAAQFEQCVGVDFTTVPNAPCIPANQPNCLVFGSNSAFTNFTSDDAELPFNWLCSVDLGCGIATIDTNSTTGFLGSRNGSVTFGAANRVVGFINSGQTITRKVRDSGVRVIDKRVEYVFSFDFCFANATNADQSVSLSVDIANVTDVIQQNIVPTTSVTVPADIDQSTCGRLVARVPHYVLFSHIGINGFAVRIQNTGSVRVFIDTFLVQALPVISNDEGDTCQFLPSVVNTFVPVNTPACTRVFINEINYRNVTFTGMQITPTEALEIAGPAGTDLTNMKIVLVNFDANGVPQQTSIVMGAEQGTVTIPESPEAPGFGFVTVAFSQGLPDGVDGIGIDGVALFQRATDTVPIQFVCFGTNASATNLPILPFPCSTVVDLNGLAVNDTTDPGSVHLIGCGNCYQDFDWGFATDATIVNASAGLPFQNTGQQFVRDQDNDGYWDDQFCGGNDCNDLVSFIFPGAVEICDGEQTNCIGPIVNETDSDGDGRLTCDGDCNDADPTTFGLARFFVNGSIAAGGQIATTATGCRAIALTVNNSQLELCDLLDNDCDGLVNEAFRTLFHFRDNDFDGFADINADDRDTAEFPDCQNFTGCEVNFPRGWSPNRTDCNDTDPNIHPDGNSFCRINDTCDGVDNNCNGIVDELEFIDLDRDGFANESASNEFNCIAFHPAAFVGDGDCNDRANGVNPNATEQCNRIDDNCDEQVDEGLFIDLDGDTFGNRTASHPNCTAFYNLNDCDDRNDTTLFGPIGNFSNPGRTEILCDGLDNDCNAVTPDSRVETCDRIDTDCNCGLYNDPTVTFVPFSNCTGDENATRFDNGIVSDNDTDDAYAFPLAFRSQCLAAGYIFDCNDNNSTFPSAEVCDLLDNDCDGVPDDGFFLDSDRDFWPDFDLNSTCDPFYANRTADCAPQNPAINPGAIENASFPDRLCNNVDDDCNNSTGFGSNGGAGALNENSSIAILFDGDNDGFRNLTVNGTICRDLVLFDAFLNQPLDCDDNDPRRHPCRLDEFVCLTRIGGVKPLPCGVDEHRVCGRELVPVGGLIVPDGIDNDCVDGVDNLVEFAVHIVLRGEFFDAAEATSSSSSASDDDDDSSSSKSDQFCADIKVTLTNDSPRDLKDIVIKGQLTLPPKGQLVEYIFGDLTNFGVKVDTRTLRVAWVQFKLEDGVQQEVVFPVCVRRREHIFGVQLTLGLEDYSLAGDVVPEPLNVQKTTTDSFVTITAQ